MKKSCLALASCILSICFQLDATSDLLWGLLRPANKVGIATDQVYSVTIGAGTFGAYVYLDRMSSTCSSLYSPSSFSSIPANPAAASTDGTFGTPYSYGSPFVVSSGSTQTYYLTGEALYNYANALGWGAKVQSIAILDFGNLPSSPTTSSVVANCIAVTNGGTTYSSATTGSVTLTAITTAPETPVGWWPLNEGTGSTAYDISGNGNNGSWNGIAGGTDGAYYDENGLQGQQVGTFDKTTNYINTSVSIPTSGSIVLSAYPTEPDWHWASPAGFKGSSTAYVLIDQLDTGTWRAAFRINNALGAEVDVVGPSIVANTWYHLALTWSLSGTTYTFYLYVDGVQYGPGLFSNADTTPDPDMEGFYMGTSGSTADDLFPGQIGNVRLYDTALTSDEISAIYNAEAPVSPVAWWRLDEGSGSTAYDISGNGHNGTWYGTAVGAGGTYYVDNGEEGQEVGDFDGSSDYISTPVGITTSGTLAAWAYPTSPSTNWAAPAGWKDSADLNAYVFFDQGGTSIYDPGGPGKWRVAFRINNNGGTVESDVVGPAITADTWYHLVLTWSLSGTTYTINFYVDGVSQGSTTWSDGSTTPYSEIGYLWIGSGLGSTAYQFPGEVSDVRVYNSALTPTQVAAIYNEEL